jgi:glycosyltransferase involved in cell wall biosynthesis
MVATVSQSEVAEVIGPIIQAGVRRVHALAWRDLDDHDAGGSERHADEVFSRWAEHGLDIRLRTSAARSQPSSVTRHGYRVVRRGGRLGVFPRAVTREITSTQRPDAMVEIWNGVPWGSPLWWRRHPGIVILHHVHGPMWDQLLPRPLAALGRRLESRWAPPWYRSTPTVTPSEATRQELLTLGWPHEGVTAVNNGIEPWWQPDPAQRAAHPTVVAVGRLAPVKRFDLVIDQAVVARQSIPDLQLVIVGDGPERPRLEAHIAAVGAQQWITMTGRLEAAELRRAYQQAWLVVSGSLAEGWGLSLTEAAACGTPAVATDIGGHRCSVVDGTTGVLTAPQHLGTAIAQVLTDHRWREVLGRHALERSTTLTWDATAAGIGRVLLDEVRRHQMTRC